MSTILQFLKELKIQTKVMAKGNKKEREGKRHIKQV